MVGNTLVRIREHVEALAVDDGTYYLVCARTGDRPVPAAALRFGSRPTARAAARATEQYRAALRRYDPRLPFYDVVVCEDAPEPTGAGRSDLPPSAGVPTLDGPAPTSAADREPTGPERRRLVEFCHRVAAAAFEALSDDGYDAVETAVMDAYFDLAETVADPDDLCFCLLESLATELGSALTPAEQADVLSRAARQLSPTGPAERPLTATLASLRELGLFDDFTRSPGATDLEGGTRSVVVRLSDYALSPRRGRLPVLPVVVDLYRRELDWPPSGLRVVDDGDGWRVTFAFARNADPAGLVSVPIEPAA